MTDLFFVGRACSIRQIASSRGRLIGLTLGTEFLDSPACNQSQPCRCHSTLTAGACYIHYKKVDLFIGLTVRFWPFAVSYNIWK